ncbi:MAG: glucose 1-dehydrogenase [Chloroflexota bacterium]|nr:glucose 1-dehydrogenase [Chloroflexota bacterium]
MAVLDAFRLDGKVAIVTGGNQGIGEALARALSEAGAAVAIAARRLDPSEAVASSIRSQGGDAIATHVDVTRPEQVREMLADVTQRLGPVDVLVNNAGVCYHRPAFEVPAEEWHNVFDVNVHGLWHCARAAGEQMIERGSGAIINIGSMSGLIVNRPQMQPAYNASKAAVHHLTRSLAAEWAPYNVRVNALAPGYVRTAMSPVDKPEFRPRWIEDAPMRRVAEPEELGPAVVFLASDASSFITGEVLVIDGGYTLY